MNPNHHRKRDFSKSEALHVVLRSRHNIFWGKKVRFLVDKLLLAYAKYFGLKIYHRAYVGTHLHLILMPRTKKDLSGFLRVLSGQIAVSLKTVGEVFWASRPWSKILKWGRNYGTAVKYIALNYLEGINAILRLNNGKSELKQYEVLIKKVLDEGLTKIPVSLKSAL